MSVKDVDFYRILSTWMVFGDTFEKDEDFGRSAPFLFCLIMKKLFTLILISMIAFNAIHAHIIYNLSDDGTLNISGTDMPDYTLVSPGQGIVYSSAPWHNDRDKIKKVVIKEGVSNIGRNAFYDCPNLTSVTISNTVESIKEKAFYLCM